MLQEGGFAEEEPANVFFGAEDGREHVCLVGFADASEVLDLHFLAGEDKQQIVRQI